MKIKNLEIVKKINEVIERDIKPALAMDGGDIEFCGFEDGVVSVRLRGACGCCPGAAMTLKMGVERKLKEFVPEVKEVRPA